MLSELPWTWCRSIPSLYGITQGLLWALFRKRLRHSLTRRLHGFKYLEYVLWQSCHTPSISVETRER
jgi:hypothetical protein